MKLKAEKFLETYRLFLEENKYINYTYQEELEEVQDALNEIKVLVDRQFGYGIDERIIDNPKIKEMLKRIVNNIRKINDLHI